jgi:hypothetical protein
VSVCFNGKIFFLQLKAAAAAAAAATAASGKIQSSGYSNGSIATNGKTKEGTHDGEAISNGHCNGVCKNASHQNGTANGCTKASAYYVKSDDITANATTNLTQRIKVTKPEQ